MWYLFQGALKNTSQYCRLLQINLRAPLGRTMWWMVPLRTFPTQSRMIPLKRWVSSLKLPLLLRALSSLHLTWPQPSATGFNLKTTHPGPAPHHLLRKQVGQAGGKVLLWYVLNRMLFCEKYVGLPVFYYYLRQSPKAPATEEKADRDLIWFNYIVIVERCIQKNLHVLGILAFYACHWLLTCLWKNTHFF